MPTPQAVLTIAPKPAIGFPRTWTKPKWAFGGADGVFAQLESREVCGVRGGVRWVGGGVQNCTQGGQTHARYPAYLLRLLLNQQGKTRRVHTEQANRTVIQASNLGLPCIHDLMHVHTPV